MIMRPHRKSWNLLVIGALACIAGIISGPAVEAKDETSRFEESDQAFLDGNFTLGETILNELIASNPGDFELATQALHRMCLSEYLELMDKDWPNQGYPNQMFNKAGRDHEKAWALISQYLREGFLETGKFAKDGEQYDEDPRKRPFFLESLWRKVADYPLTPQENMSDEAAERILTLQRSGYLEADDPAVIDASILLYFIRKSQRRYLEVAELIDNLVITNNKQIDWLLARAKFHAWIKSPRANDLFQELFEVFENPGIDPVISRAAKRAETLKVEWFGFVDKPLAESKVWLKQMISDDQNSAWERVASGFLNGAEKEIDLWIQSALGPEQSKAYLIRQDNTGSARTWYVLDDQLKSLDAKELKGLREHQERRCLSSSGSRDLESSTQKERLALFRRFPWAKTAHRALMAYAQEELEAGRGQAARRAFRDLIEHTDDPHLLGMSQVGLWLAIAQGKNHEELAKQFSEVDPEKQFPWMNATATSKEISKRLLKMTPAKPSKTKSAALSELDVKFLKLPARPLWPPMRYRRSPGLSFVHMQNVGSNLLVSTRNLLAWYGEKHGENPVWVDTARGGHGDHSISRMGKFRPIIDGNRIYTRWGYRADPLTLVAMDLQTREIIWSQKLADAPNARRIVSLGNPILSGGQIYLASAWNEHSRSTGRFQFQLSSLDAASGRVNWREDLSISTSQQTFEGVFGESLTVRDGSIYCSPSTGFVGRFDARDGKMEWMYNYQSVAGHQLIGDTRGNAPLVVGNVLVGLPRDTNVIVGLDRRTGKLLWKSYLPLATEIIGQVGDNVLVQGRTTLASINAITGKTTWHSAYPDQIAGSVSFNDDSIFLASQDTIYRYDAATGIEQETRIIPTSRNSIRNVAVMNEKVYLITDKPSAGKESSFVRDAPGDIAWEVTTFDPRLYIPVQGESNASEMLIHENDMLHCLETTPKGKALWQRFVYPRPNEIFFVEGKAVLLYHKGRYDVYLKALNQKTGDLEWELTLLRLRAGHGATVGRSGKYLYGKDNSDRFYLVDLNLGKVVLQNRIPRKNGNVKAGFGGGKVHFLMTPAYQRNLYWLQWDITNNEIAGTNQVLRGRDGDANKAFNDNWVEFAKFGEHACYFICRQEGAGREYVAYRTNYKDQSIELVGRNTRHLKFEPPFIFMQQQETDQNKKARTHTWSVKKEDDPNYSHSLDLPHSWYHKPTYVNGHVLEVRTPVRNQNPYTVRVHDLSSKRTLMEHTSEDTERMGGIPVGTNRVLVYDWKRNVRNTPPHFKLTLYDLDTGHAGPTTKIDYWESNSQHPNDIRVAGDVILINDRYSVKAWQLKL